MSVICEKYIKGLDGVDYDGLSYRYSIQGPGKLSAKVINYGARIQELNVPDSITGEVADVMHGFDELKGYIYDGGNHGAVVGRCANRISGARFSIDGVEYNVMVNDGPNNLHTGNPAIQNLFWNSEVMPKAECDKFIKDSGIVGLCDSEEKLSFDDGVLLTIVSPDGECGFPGNLTTSVLYTWLNDGTFIMIYKGVSDKATVFAPTNHAYFNIGGEGSGSIRNEILTVKSDEVLHKDQYNCPDGDIIKVEGTDFDFRNGAKLEQAIISEDPQIKNCLGLDSNFNLKNEGRYECIALLEDDRTNRKMETWTDLPGIQFYTANHMHGDFYKNGHTYHPYDAVCCEAGMYPNAVNLPQFDSPVIKAGEVKYHACGYKFV